MLKGLGVSPGIVIGKVYILDRRKVTVDKLNVDEDRLPQEIDRFRKAIEVSKKQLEKVKEELVSKMGEKSHNYIIDAHLQILQDQLLIDDTIDKIKQEKVTAEWALSEVIKNFSAVFESMEDEYLRERKNDINHVGERILTNLVGRRIKSLSELAEDVVVVAHDLTPADTAQMHRGKVIGFATEMGGRTSHTAIIARSLEIPAVVGLEAITQEVKSGDAIIVDGNGGVVIINPSNEVFKEYLEKQQRYKYFEKELLKQKDLPSETKDGYHITLMANIEFPDEIQSVLDHGATGIGLYRTEYLFMNRVDLPTEDEHFYAYKFLAENIKPHTAIIRTLDLGGDKLSTQLNLPVEVNPALGLRAIRLCLKQKDIFVTQLRAILRASVYGNLKILFPMISGVKELREARKILEEVKQDLKREAISFNESIEIGLMIEVPSAAITADLLAKEVDYFSMGTNDLIQYSLAIDRGNEHVSYLYEPLHPAVLRILKSIINSAHGEGIPVGMCGEMAGDPLYTIVLIGLGVDSLSMNAVAVPKVKTIIRSINLAEAVAMTYKVLTLSTAEEIENYVEGEMKEKFFELQWT
ncbi:MAG: phosphoenolpyruvate--protein phosphotransferase [bacterium]